MRPKRGTTSASDAAWTVLGVAWIGGGGAGAVSILTLSDDGALILTAFVLITALDDIGGFFIGSKFGKHKMAPSISPAKSWEGFAGGLCASLLGGVLFGVLLFDLSVPEGLGLAAIASFLAPVGDLSESLVKRELGVKDSGRLLPGHGGFLDRLDAILFCAPAAFLYLKVVVFG
jgi:phosphatidate cytidylyltransferase